MVRNGDFDPQFQLFGADGTPASLTGFTFDGYMKKDHNSTTQIDLHVSVTDYGSGTIGMYLDHTVTSGTKYSQGIYAVRMTQPNFRVYPIIYGSIEVVGG